MLLNEPLFQSANFCGELCQSPLAHIFCANAALTSCVVQPVMGVRWLNKWLVNIYSHEIHQPTLRLASPYNSSRQQCTIPFAMGQGAVGGAKCA